ncbi:MAG: PrsW family intramembrane metalloprotease [Bacteroidia bacterium]|nr:PrsW family intramembrane metalloprotease [Bacteroidia bacterium]
MAQTAGEIVILFTLFLLVVPALLVRKFGNDKKTNRPWWQFGDYNIIVMSLIWFFILVITVNVISPEPDLSTPDKAIDFGNRRGIPEFALWGFEQKMLAEKNLMFYHLKSLDFKHDFETEKKMAAYKSHFKSNLEIDDFHDSLILSQNKDLRDAGYFATAYSFILRDSSSELIQKNLEKISDQQKSCVQYLYALLQPTNGEKESYYKKDLRNKGNMDEDVDWLSSYYFKRADYISLLQLYQDKAAFQFLDLRFKKIISFRNAHYFDFLLFDFEYVFKSWNIAGIAGAFLIFMIWLYYIRKIDLFETERKRYVLLTVFLGCISVFLCLLLYHIERYYLDFYETGEAMNDLAYNIIGVGLLEELIKIIPFLILLRFTKAINEPIDYIIFGALSAMSFAFIENIIYFDEDGMYNIHSRALWCVMSHVADTCIITYLLMLTKWYPGLKGWKKNPYLIFFAGLFIAATVHGLYDFFLDKKFAEIWVIPFGIVLSEIVVFTSMVNNCLNNSPFYSAAKNINTNKLGAILSSALFAVIVFEYICLSFIYGVSTGNMCLVDALTESWYLLMFLALRLTSLDVFPKRWEKLQFFSSLNPFVFIMSRKINFAKYVGMELVFNGGRKNAAILDYMPLKGVIRSRQLISDYAGWFVVELDKGIVSKKQTHTLVLMRSQEKNTAIEKNQKISVLLFLMPDKDYLQQEEKKEEDLIFLDWVLIS